VPRGHQIPAHIFAGPDQVPGRLGGHGGHRHRGDLPERQQPRQVPGVTRVGLDPIPQGRASLLGAATTVFTPCPSRNRAGPNPAGPASYVTATGPGKLPNHASNSP